MQRDLNKTGVEEWIFAGLCMILQVTLNFENR